MRSRSSSSRSRSHSAATAAGSEARAPAAADGPVYPLPVGRRLARAAHGSPVPGRWKPGGCRCSHGVSFPAASGCTCDGCPARSVTTAFASASRHPESLDAPGPSSAAGRKRALGPPVRVRWGWARALPIRSCRWEPELMDPTLAALGRYWPAVATGVARRTGRTDTMPPCSSTPNRIGGVSGARMAQSSSSPARCAGRAPPRTARGSQAGTSTAAPLHHSGYVRDMRFPGRLQVLTDRRTTLAYTHARPDGSAPAAGGARARAAPSGRRRRRGRPPHPVGGDGAWRSACGADGDGRRRRGRPRPRGLRSGPPLGSSTTVAPGDLAGG